MDFEKLRQLLDNETYPYAYIHKFIGVKSATFLTAVAQLEAAHPRAKRKGERETSDTKGKVYIALTYELLADSSAEIIALLRSTSKLPDLKIIL